MICPFCKQEIKSDIKFCYLCGKEIPAQKSPEAKKNILKDIFSKIVHKKDEPDKKDIRGITYELVVIEGDDKGKSFELGKKPVAIGRRLPKDTRENDILLTDMEATISTEQARLYWSPERDIHVIDFVGGVKNPTIVDGIIIEKPTYLIKGCRIIIGRNVLLYQQKKNRRSIPKMVRKEMLEMEEKPLPSPLEIETNKELTEEKVPPMTINTGYMLKIISGLQKNTKINLDRPLISIGKLTAKEKPGWILVDSSFVSPDQATIRWMRRDNKFGILHTKKAANPTLVNGREISDKHFTMLEKGDLIQIGNIKIILGKTDKPEEEKSLPINPPPPEPDKYQLRQKKQKLSEPLNAPGYKKITDISPTKGILASANILGGKKSIPKKEDVIKPYRGGLIKRGSGKLYPGEVPEQDNLSKEKSFSKKQVNEDDDVTIAGTTIDGNLKNVHCITVISGEDKDSVFIIDENMIDNKMIIGCKGKNDEKQFVALSDDNISEKHASLNFENRCLCINLEDENKELLVNDVSVLKKGLENGDLIEIGYTIMEYKYSSDEAGQSLPASIEIIEGIDKGKVFSLNRDLIRIGRKSKKDKDIKDIALSEKDRSISRKHIRIEKKKEQYYLINEKETNLTILNVTRIKEPALLKNGDKIKLGKEAILLFKDGTLPFIPRHDKKDLHILKRTEPPESNAVFIEGGKFYMGTDHIKCDANPMHIVNVNSFYIDRYAVTNIQFANLVRITNYKSEGNWQEYFTEGKEYYPVVGVTYNDALFYAKKSGKRLPTESEWEKAARGDRGILYPWGNEWDPVKLNSNENNNSGGITPVDNYPGGASPYGVMDILGNIWEWTADYYEKYPYQGPYPVRDKDKAIAIKGGDWTNKLKQIGIAIRMKLLPGEFAGTVGFRCAKDA